MAERVELYKKCNHSTEWIAEQCGGVLENAGISQQELGYKYLQFAATIMIICNHCSFTPEQAFEIIAWKGKVSIEDINTEILKCMKEVKEYLSNDEKREAFQSYFESDFCDIISPEGFTQEVANIVIRFYSLRRDEYRTRF